MLRRSRCIASSCGIHTEGYFVPAKLFVTVLATMRMRTLTVFIRSAIVAIPAIHVRFLEGCSQHAKNERGWVIWCHMN